jgi:hypothetical protein
MENNKKRYCVSNLLTGKANISDIAVAEDGRYYYACATKQLTTEYGTSFILLVSQDSKPITE